MSVRRRLVATTAVLALVAGACGGDSGGESDAAGATPTVTTAPTAAAAAEAAPSGADESAPAPSATEESPTEQGEPEIVRFTTPDGEELEGTVYGTGPTGVVLAHMRGRDRSTWTAFATVAAAEGHQVLTFDFRGYGGSSGERDTNLDVDLEAAIDLLESRGIERVLLMGASMGGTAVVNVAARVDTAGAVSLSAPGDFQGLPATAVAGELGEPLLLIAAENDQPYADAATEMHSLAGTSQLKIFSGNAHGTNLFGDHDDELTSLLLTFIADRSR